MASHLVVKRRACPSCGQLHCFWCGGEFDLKHRQDNNPAAPTREHLFQTHEEWTTAKAMTLVPVVLAHYSCNTLRQHEQWVPFHCSSWPERKSPQLRAEAKALAHLDRNFNFGAFAG